MKLNLPTQAKSVDRDNRMAAAQAAGVNPAFFSGLGDILKKGLGVANSYFNG